ncbi:MAG: sulfatase-like hydrolase/transferase [Pirellulales bacterium]
MNIYRILFVVAVVIGPSAAIAQAKATNKPNVVLIMADDLGIEGLGSYGGTSYATPNLDQLAAEGMRYTHAYAQPLCTNTRIQLMTGKYNSRNWLYFGILDPREKTFGHYMQDAGYKTCISGKWQLYSYDPLDYPGAEKRRSTGTKAEDAGFDEYFLWHVDHTEDKGSRYASPVISNNGKFVANTEDKYGPDFFVDYIGDFMKRHKDEPFFVYYSMALPHWPMVPTPDSRVWSDPSRRLEEDTVYFKDMVQYTDKMVGKVIQQLEDLNLTDNTLLIFYSDNGTHLKITSMMGDTPVAGGKGESTDAGTHVPLIAKWPGNIEPGTVNDNLVDSTDFLPTIVEAAGSQLPKNTVCDGVSFYQQLLGKKPKSRDWVFVHFDPRPGWDKDRFRLVIFARDRKHKLYSDGRLFDIEKDVLEKSSIPAANDTQETQQARKRLQIVLDQHAIKPL